jgi:lysophospholipase L1-like esterase
MHRKFLPSCRKFTCSAAAALMLVAPAAAKTPLPAKQSACVIASENASSLGITLSRAGTRLMHGDSVTIVAIGSSSTAGAGASSPAASYPSRLQVLLSERFPGRTVRVINRGVNGEVTSEMLARFDREVLAQKPDLVLWQVGTNELSDSRSMAAMPRLIHRGVQRLKASGADVVLIDPQYAPAVIAKARAKSVVDMIAAQAREEKTGLFRRFELMRSWHENNRIPFGAFVTRDSLHMNDWGYDCLARQLAAAIADSAGGTVLAGSARSEVH